MSSQPILIVEDSADDALLMEMALGEIGIGQPIRTLRNGAEAIAYLAGTGQFSDRDAFPLPMLVLLDLEMPIEGGVEVLRWLNEHSNIKTKLQIIVMSGTLRPSTAASLLEMGARSVFEKPLNYHQLCEKLQSLITECLGPGGQGPTTNP